MSTKIIDIPEKDIRFIKWLILILRLFGLWRLETDHKIYLLYSVLYYTIYSVAFGASLFIYLLFVAENFDEFTECTFVAFTVLALAIKNFNLLYRNKKIQELYHTVKNFQLNIIDGDNWEVRFFQKRIKLLRNMAFIYFAPAVVTAIFTSCAPIYTSKPIYSAWHPMDWHGSQMNFNIIWIFEGLAAFLCSINSSALDLLPTIILWITVVQMEILGYRIKGLGGSEQEMKKRIIDCIKCYQSIIELVDRSENLFSIAYLGQIAVSGIAICTNVIWFSAASPLDDFNKYLVHVFTLMFLVVQILIPCYVGNFVLIRSEALLFHLYDSSWECVKSKEYRLLVIIFMERLKQPSVITIGKLFPLDLMTFLSIINFAYRSYAVLQDMQ